MARRLSGRGSVIVPGLVDELIIYCDRFADRWDSTRHRDDADALRRGEPIEVSGFTIMGPMMHVAPRRWRDLVDEHDSYLIGPGDRLARVPPTKVIDLESSPAPSSALPQ